MDITTEIRIEKQDLVTLAIANGEKKMRKELAALKATIATADKNIADLEKRLEEETQRLIPKTIQNMVKRFNDNKDIDIQQKLSCRIYRGTDNNVVEISIGQKGGGWGSTYVTLASKKVPFSTAQTNFKVAIKEQQELKEQVQQEAVDIRRKLSDIPAFERQMRARIVELELGKTDEGRKYLASLTDGAVDDAIKLIGM